MKWKSIKSAPHRPLDKYHYGPRILLFTGKGLRIGFWDQDFAKFYVEEDDHDFQPTHWMPFPADPT